MRSRSASLMIEDSSEDGWLRLLAATVRCRHFHLLALAVHHAAAGALVGCHLRVRYHASHGRSQA